MTDDLGKELAENPTHEGIDRSVISYYDAAHARMPQEGA